MTVTLPRPDCVNILWTILSGLHLAEYVTKSISKFRRNVMFSHYRLENGGHISRPQCANTLLLKQNIFYFADDMLIYIFECVLLLYMQLSYLKMNLKSWSAKYRPCLCLEVLIRCGSDKVTSILKRTFSISFITSCEIWNDSHVTATMLWGRDKMVPLSRWYIQINFPIWNCFIIFFQIWLKCISKSWWRHQMETFSALLAICAGNSPVPGELPAQRPVTLSFDIFFDTPLNNRLSKQSWGWWSETLSHTFDVTVMFPHRNLLYHLNILLCQWEGIKRRAQDMTSLKWKRFP